VRLLSGTLPVEVFFGVFVQLPSSRSTRKVPLSTRTVALGSGACTKCIARQCETKLPVLPIRRRDAKRLFGKLVRKNKSAKLDFQQMALDWCNHVDGKNIWPTLPAYLRVYHSKWQKGQQAKDALRHTESGVEALNNLIQLSNRRIAADMQSRNPQSTGAAIPITQAELLECGAKGCRLLGSNC